MTRRLGPADYREMPWANGRGTTVELLREDGPEGLALRLSMATVSEDGPFSALPGIDRVLVLIDGPGFHLRVDGAERPVGLLEPVRFSGDSQVAATGVTGPSRDFNVMTQRGGATPRVSVLRPGGRHTGARLFAFALAAAEIALPEGPQTLGRHDLVETTGDIALTGGGPALVIALD